MIPPKRSRLRERGTHFCSRLAGLISELLNWRDERASQLVEFAVALPLLIVFVVGIFDFSNAFTLKQKLTNITRDAARTAASEPTVDLANPSAAFPVSVHDAFYIIDNYLKANNIDDCGVVLKGAPIATLTWQFQVASGSNSACGITITINRGYYFVLQQPTLAPTASCTPGPTQGLTQVVGTCVSIQYSYPWRFGQVVGLIGGSSKILPQSISTVAVAGNEF